MKYDHKNIILYSVGYSLYPSEYCRIICINMKKCCIQNLLL